ncbi:unnamed protein product [Cuscuta epithymum]|uniref:Phytocyanin domain-containing protein n=1 Tax=Cuscuta epithymum TaxID=186058 RepID=A0AAV0CW70_9ASTE|nr:unnamed protein product [Cuscuta epithymum]
MGGKVILMILAVAAAAIGFRGSDAATYSVGNGAWSIPTSNSAYSDWAKNIKFAVGDVLTFNFTTGAHTVAEVNKKDYDSCNVGSPILIDNNGPANITLKSTGPHYFVCTIHCAQGQKLTVNVTSAGSTSSPPKSSPAPGSTPSSPPPPTGSSPSPGSSTSTPPPPPPSGATSVSIFSGLMFLPIFLAALL